MKWITTLLIILCSCSVDAIIIRKIDRYDGVDFYPIEELYCSSTRRSIKFDGEHQYRSTNVTLLSPHLNGIIKIEHSKNVIIKNNFVKILKGEDKTIRMKLLPFDGECKIQFYDSISKELLSELILEGVLKSHLTQRTTVQYDKKTRIYHNIQYKDWSFNVGMRENKTSTFDYNISISKRWR